ncbi:MAG: methionyl-tRNA formyltransferase [Cellvibrionaceae bacterium]
MQQNSRLRLIFAGTPTFAADHLQALIDSPHEIVAVYTQPDRPAGRGKKLTPSPVKVLAEAHGLPVLQPEKLKSEEDQQVLADLNADLMIVVAYGLILPQKVLDTPRLGCINVHGSLLPRWRGAAPVQRAIEVGDTETGITIMQMNAGLDTGPMLAKSVCSISDEDTTISIFEKLTTLGTDLLIKIVDDLADDSSNVTSEAQDDSQATYAEKITKQEAMINWNESANIIHRKIRAFNPFPIAYSELGNERVKIYAASIIETSDIPPQSIAPRAGKVLYIDDEGITICCGPENTNNMDNGSNWTALRIEEIQLPGKKAMSTKAILLGNKERFQIGDQFSVKVEKMSNSEETVS